MGGNVGSLGGRSLSRYLLIAGGAVGLLAVLWMAPAYACGPSSVMTMNPTEAPAGDTVTVFGTGFYGGTPVTITWAGQDGDVLATPTTDFNGQFAAAVTIPDVPAGAYTITAVQGNPDNPEAAPYVNDEVFTVLAAVTPAWSDGAELDVADVTANSADLSWPAANGDVAGYRVFRNDAEVADQSATTFHANTLDPDTEYTFAVEAYDAEGNVSATRLSGVVATLPADTVAGACPGPAGGPAFTDIAGNAHQDAIECAAAYGIAQGTTATTYSPALGVRRDQMASFIVRLLTEAGMDLPAPDGGPFTDVAGNTHEVAINQLAELGVVHGITTTTYGPGATVSRAQMASFLVRAYEQVGADLPAGSTPFTDIAGNTHEDAIAKSYEAGFAFGTTETTYAPKLAVRRDQMASFLTRVLEAFVAQAA